MVWCKKHLHWTWIMITLLRFSFITLDSPVPYIIYSVAFLGVTLWVLHQKGRSLVWVLMPIAVLFLRNNRVRVKEVSDG